MNRFLFITFALRFLGLGKVKSQSNARLSLLGSAFGIGISIIPLVVVLFVSDGMVQGIAERTVELGTGQIAIIDVHPSTSFPNCEHELELKKILKEKIKAKTKKNTKNKNLILTFLSTITMFSKKYNVI